MTQAKMLEQVVACPPLLGQNFELCEFNWGCPLGGRSSELVRAQTRVSHDSGFAPSINQEDFLLKGRGLGTWNIGTGARETPLL